MAFDHSIPLQELSKRLRDSRNVLEAEEQFRARGHHHGRCLQSLRLAAGAGLNKRQQPLLGLLLGTEVEGVHAIAGGDVDGAVGDDGLRAETVEERFPVGVCD
jgi:hypothetical protein